MEIRTPAADDAPGRLAEPAPLPAVPSDDECVLCYVDRMLESHGCDTTLRWARRWRELRAPAARGLERRLEARGGFCDCEVLLNGWSLREDLQLRDEDGELVWPSPGRPARGWARGRPSRARTGSPGGGPGGEGRRMTA